MYSKLIKYVYHTKVLFFLFDFFHFRRVTLSVGWGEVRWGEVSLVLSRHGITRGCCKNIVVFNFCNRSGMFFLNVAREP